MISLHAAALAMVAMGVVGTCFGLWLRGAARGESDPTPIARDPLQIEPVRRLPPTGEPVDLSQARVVNVLPPDPDPISVAEVDLMAAGFDPVGIRLGRVHPRVYRSASFAEPPVCVADHQLAEGADYFEIELPDEGDAAVLAVCAEHARHTTPEVDDEGPRHD